MSHALLELSLQVLEQTAKLTAHLALVAKPAPNKLLSRQLTAVHQDISAGRVQLAHSHKERLVPKTR
jgi:hypothetical protein